MHMKNTKHPPFPTNSNDFLEKFNFIRPKKQEYLVCLSLDASNRPIRRRIVTIGLLDAVQMHPREVFAPVIADRAACVIIAHNHPSGRAEPSRQDIKTTQQLVAAGILLGVHIHDHYILTRTSHFSFKGCRLI
jgi:DNA repair protein RadC